MKNSEMVYKACLSAAMSSSCRKMGFGCVAVLDNQFIHIDNNQPLPYTATVCQEKCIRDDIKSRTHSMLGACAHAEERTIVFLAKHYSADTLPRINLFVAGVQLHDGIYHPLAKTRNDFSCVRCATQMALYGMPGVYIYRTDLEKWKFVNTKNAVEGAYEYALEAREAEASYV